MPENLQKISAIGRFLAFRLLGRNVPLAVYWKITYQCNSACVYCGIRDKPVADMPTDALTALMREACRAGLYRANLSGGEPLLREDFGILVRCLQEQGASVGVDTNGSLVEERLDDLLPVDSVALSLDGDRAIHDSHRGSGSFEKANRAAEVLRRAGVPMSINCLITSKNFDRLDRVLEVARFHGVQVLFQPATSNKHDSKEPNPIAPSAEQVREAIGFLATNRHYRRHIANPGVYFKTLRDYPRLPLLPCPGGRLACLVNPDGMIGSCDFDVPVDPWRDARKAGFAAAFADLTRPPPCNQCSCATVVSIQHAMRLNPDALWNLVRSC